MDAFAAMLVARALSSDKIASFYMPPYLMREALLHWLINVCQRNPVGVIGDDPIYAH